MTPVKETYLSLLESGIRQTLPPEVEPGLLPRVWELSSSQCTRGFVLDAYLRSQSAKDASKEVLQKARGCLHGIMMGHLGQARALSLVLETLSKEGIRGVLLKGEGNSALYANPMLRETGDIDLWVGQEAYAQALECLGKVSEGLVEEDEEELEKHTGMLVGGVVVEVHALTGHAFTKSKDALYQAYAHKGLHDNLDTAVVSGISVSVPEPTFNAFYVFHHFFCHFMQGGVGLRQVADWAVLLESRKDAIDWDRLGKMVTDMGLQRPWNVFLQLCVQYLGLSCEILPATSDKTYGDLAGKVLDRILEEGNFGKSRHRARRSGTYVFDKALSLWEHLRRYAALLRIFPLQALTSFFQSFLRSSRAVFRDLADSLGLRRKKS